MEISKAADKIEQEVISWREDIHEHPELGNREFRTSEMIARHLESLGLEVKTNVGFTAVVGLLKGDKPGPVIALRADMDALPVEEKTGLPFASKEKTTYNNQETFVMHACGHDAHVAILMGVAEILSGMKKDLKGTIKFIFQPAEEGAPKGEEGGAALLIKEGVLENPRVDVIFGLHIDPLAEIGTIGYRSGSLMSSVSDFKLTIIGKSAHSSQPWLAVDPIVVSAQIINSLQTIISRNINLTQNPAVVTIASIHSGNRSNIIPGQSEMTGTIRTYTQNDRELIFHRVNEIVTKTADAAGASSKIELPYSINYPVTINNEKLTTAMLPSFQKSAGKENVIVIPVRAGSEDFSFYQEKVPGLFFFIGGLSKGKDIRSAAPLHTSEMVIDESGLKTGIVAFCNLVFDYQDIFHNSQTNNNKASR
jgi:amidohydrolase